MDRYSVMQGLRTALVVGTLLVLINGSGALLAGQFSGRALLRTALTYAVPFLVSVYSLRRSAALLRPRALSSRAQPLVCLSCKQDPPCVTSVEAGAAIPDCPGCGAHAVWTERGRVARS